jgi:hypothetical protein
MQALAPPAPSAPVTPKANVIPPAASGTPASTVAAPVQLTVTCSSPTTPATQSVSPMCRNGVAPPLGWTRLAHIANRAPSGPQATAALAAHAILREAPSVEVVLATIDSRARKPGDLGDGGQPTIASGAHLGSSEQPAPALVEPVAKAIPTLLDALPVDHASAIVVFASDGNPPTVSHSVTRPQIAIRL